MNEYIEKHTVLFHKNVRLNIEIERLREQLRLAQIDNNQCEIEIERLRAALEDKIVDNVRRCEEQAAEIEKLRAAIYDERERCVRHIELIAADWREVGADQKTAAAEYLAREIRDLRTLPSLEPGDLVVRQTAVFHENVRLKTEIERLRAALKAARDQLITLGGDTRKHPEEYRDMIQTTVLEIVDGAMTGTDEEPELYESKKSAT